MLEMKLGLPTSQVVTLSKLCQCLLWGYPRGNETDMNRSIEKSGGTHVKKDGVMGNEAGPIHRVLPVAWVPRRHPP
jgi:hypothetical protein